MIARPTITSAVADIVTDNVTACTSEAFFKKSMERSIDIGARMEFFLATGNVISSTGLDLMQVRRVFVLECTRSLARSLACVSAHSAATRKRASVSWPSD